MLRRRIPFIATATFARYQSVSVPQDVRDKLSKSFMSVKEEAKGQALDLGDMAEAARNAAKNVATATKAHPVEDAKFKAKLVTLNASMKAYNSRLMNLQSEARALQNDVDTILKLLWSNQADASGAGASAAAAAEPESEKVEKVEGERISEPDDFAYEAPKPKVSENEAPGAAKSGAAATSTKVETVEGEVVRETPQKTSNATSSSSSSGSGEIEVEAVEIEESVETKSITEITRELHERGIDFSDCMDAKSLRARYQDVLDGKVKPPKPKAQPQPQPPPRSSYQAPSTSSSSSSSYQQQQQRSAPASNETGLTADPHPGAERRQIDSSKYVWEVKQEMAREKGFDPNSVDMWCGMIKMDDHKRIYEVPGVQSYPIQIRQKGDAPTNPYGR